MATPAAGIAPFLADLTKSHCSPVASWVTIAMATPIKDTRYPIDLIVEYSVS